MDEQHLLAWHREGLSQLDRYLTGRDLDALAQARDLFRRVVDAMTAATRGRDIHLRNLAFAEHQTYKEHGDVARLREAAVLYRRAVSAAGPDGPHRHIHEGGLGQVLRLLFHHDGDRRTLDESVSWQRRARAGPAAPQERARQESGLAGTLQDRYEHTWDLQDLADAIAHLRAALRLLPDGDPSDDRTVVLNNLAVALTAWHEHTGDDAARAEAATYRDALSGRATAAATPPPGLEALVRAEGAAEEYRRTGRPDLLDQVIAGYEHALTRISPTAPAWSHALDELCTARLDRGTPADVERVLQVLAFGRSQRPPDSYTGLIWTIRTAQAYGDRHRLTADPADIEAAVDLARTAVATGNGRAGPHTAAARVLARTLARRHAIGGDPADLDEAIELCDGLPLESDAGLELAQYLLSRYAISGARADLERGLRLARAVRDGAPAQLASLPELLAIIGGALRQQHALTGDPACLDEALLSYRQAADACDPSDQRRRLPLLCSAAQVLRQRFDLTGDADDVDEAVALLRYWRARTAGDAGHYRTITADLANALRSRFEGTGDRHDLTEAVDLLRDLIRDYPPRHPARVLVLVAHAEALYRLHLLTGERRLLDEALDAARAAASSPTAAMSEQLAAGITLGQVHGTRHEWAAAAKALRDAVALLPRLADRSLTRTDQQFALARHPGLAAEAAAYALEAGDPAQALEVLEHGRGVLLARKLPIPGGDLDRLTRAAPDLAAQFLRLRDSDDEPPPGAEPDERLLRQRRARAQDWERLLARVRALPGMARFLRPPSAASLLRQAGDDPVVLLNVSVRCDALIVAGGTVAVVPLAVTAREVQERAAAFLAVVDAAGARARTMTEVAAAEQHIAETLEWLWDVITAPVLHHLGLLGEANLPRRRIWWCPQGVLAFLPLHAAGYHRDRAGPAGRRTVLDLVISSYTPTVGALQQARDRPVAARTARPLIVALAQTPGAGPLSSADAEADEVRAVLGAATTLYGSQATRDRVLAALPDADLAHFVCHAAVDAQDPSRSRILTYDHAERPLTVADIAGLRLHDAELAYLSACSATRTRPEFADEAVHITGAFLFAGYRHVIGTLWPVVDVICAQLAGAFHRGLAAHPGDPAAALNTAVRQVRDRFPALPSLWAAHLHVGP
ncbi:CHAT domain-containing protein [Dactylosporangium vinaceum]|uniref:CHAT domain-containing protein n=1 Tax=Dactylosporangium vinaceum TaxID=53362 RepID=A0ABV5M9E6_9ACTN|nr:CHAT domain-containing protein [Dactylosporangium vinaceum]UAB99970.1 CHAT domain-containing protein [Dactylosporangium vinaceum]